MKRNKRSRNAAAQKSDGAGGAARAIRFAAGECSLGSIVVAASGKGVCAILMGDDLVTLIGNLKERFPRAALESSAEVRQSLARVIALVEAPGAGFDFPLDPRGTAFQKRVWEALRTIPAGTTRSYRAIAEQLGAPRSVRAVAQACGANPVAVAIPCHRVVRSDGRLSGYRWGVQRKTALLLREGCELAGGRVVAPQRPDESPGSRLAA